VETSTNNAREALLPIVPTPRNKRVIARAKGNSPDVTIPNPKNPGYGDNEPGDPRRMEVDADATKDTDKKNPRRT
jgi:hypothetical protein